MVSFWVRRDAVVVVVAVVETVVDKLVPGLDTGGQARTVCFTLSAAAMSEEDANELAFSVVVTDLGGFAFSLRIRRDVVVVVAFVATVVDKVEPGFDTGGPRTVCLAL